MSEDITFCDADCDFMACERNKKHIRMYWMDHSFADLKGDPGYCMKAWLSQLEKRKKGRALNGTDRSRP